MQQWICIYLQTFNFAIDIRATQPHAHTHLYSRHTHNRALLGVTFGDFTSVNFDFVAAAENWWQINKSLWNVVVIVCCCCCCCCWLSTCRLFAVATTIATLLLPAIFGYSLLLLYSEFTFVVSVVVVFVVAKLCCKRLTLLSAAIKTFATNDVFGVVVVVVLRWLSSLLYIHAYITVYSFSLRFTFYNFHF